VQISGHRRNDDQIIVPVLPKTASLNHAVIKFINNLKTVSSLYIRKEFPEQVKRFYWNKPVFCIQPILLSWRQQL